MFGYFSAAKRFLKSLSSGRRPGDRGRLIVRVVAREEANALVAAEIAALIRARTAAGKPCVLGLATGSTPTGIYAELVRLHREENLSFANVVTFNLDEYLPMGPEEPQSYHRFMHEHLFDHVDLRPGNTHLPDGMVPVGQVTDACAMYERQIREAGWVDIQLLGIGRTGHIGFNEPGSAADSRTRLVDLHETTRLDAARDFSGEANVPRTAVTMGVATILEARQVILMAFGEAKAAVVARAVEGPVTSAVPASFLQTHPNTMVVLDEPAATGLAR